MSRKRKDLNQYVDIVANIRIDHDAYVLIRNELDIAFESVGSSPTPVCVLVTGETRTGKSCAVLEFAESNPTVEEGTQTRRSIVRAITPETATVKSLLESLLKGLGDPYWSRGTVSNQTHRLHVLLEAVECKLIILDEFQHLCDKGQKLRMRTSADWLKNLLQTNRYGLIAVGLPEAASVIQNHPQLRARFDNELSMPRFDWSSTNSAAQFCGILQQFEKQLAPFELPPLKSPEMALRMYLASAGRIGLLAKLFDRAVRDAIRKNRVAIRLADLAKAYERAIWCADRFPIPDGPFAATLASLEVAGLREAVLKLALEDTFAERTPTVQVFSGREKPAPLASGSLPSKSSVSVELRKAL